MMKSTQAKLALCAGLMALSVPLQSVAADHTWLVRTTAISILSNASSNGPLKLRVGDEVSLAIDGSYFVTPNWAVNVLATFVKPEVRTESGRAGGDSLGSVGLVPPTFTGQFHFSPIYDVVKPYIGIGFNLNFFHDPNGDLSNLNVKIHNAVGFVAQAGLDYQLSDAVVLNADIKYLRFNSDVDVNANRALDDKLKFKGIILGLGLGFWI